MVALNFLITGAPSDHSVGAILPKSSYALQTILSFCDDWVGYNRNESCLKYLDSSIAIVLWNMNARLVLLDLHKIRDLVPWA